MFAADLEPEVGAALAISQRPLTVAAGQGPSGAPAWKALPSWAVIPTADKAIGAEALRAMAARAGSATVEVDGASHLVMLSQPSAVTAVILTAARSIN
jgi:pimeloyl-ACP methyl ester carboxylesterase